MGKQDIIERILSDAQAEADEIIEAAKAKAMRILADADAYAKKETAEAEQECQAFAKDVMEKKSAAARLECAKIALAEKRKVLDYIYAVALARLKARAKEEGAAFYASLLERYADNGDVVYFAEDFDIADSVALLPVFQKKNLQVAKERAKIDGGMLLVGEKADKDVSFAMLIQRDKEAHLAEIAAEIF